MGFSRIVRVFLVLVSFSAFQAAAAQDLQPSLKLSILLAPAAVTTEPQADAPSRATLDRLTANLDSAEKELERIQNLKEKGFVPQNEVDAAIIRRDLAKLELAHAQERYAAVRLSLSGCFAVGLDGAILLQSGDNILDLATKKTLLRQENSGLQCFCITEQGVLVAISHQMLGYYRDAKLVERVKLPVPGMKLAPGGEALLYIYGGDVSPNNNIYVYGKGGTYSKFLEAPGKILSLTAAEDKLFFSIGNAIYTATLGEELSLICIVPGPDIQSLAYDPASEALYFSAGDAVYRLQRGNMALLCEQLGECLKFHEGSLYVLSPKYGTLFKLTGLENTPAVAPPRLEASTEDSSSDWELLNGKLHVFLPKLVQLRRFIIRTPSVELTILATEFDLEVEDSGLTHLTPYSGTVELTADPEGLDRSKLQSWWEVGETAASEPILPERALLRVIFVQGDVEAQKASDPGWRPIAIGDILESGGSLRTGEDSLARVRLRGGSMGTLGAATVLQAKETDSQQALYKLTVGLFHVTSDLQATAEEFPIFLTPNAAVTGQRTEFDLAVDESGVTRVTPYLGKMTVGAQMQRLDQSKLKRWWDGIYSGVPAG